MKEKIPFGIQNGQLKHVSEVKSGLGCNCICPVCGCQLVAHKGVERVYHFKHKSIVADCEYRHETVLHKLAKEILLKRGEIRLPAVNFLTKTIYNSRIVRIDDVKLETRLGDVIPDVICKVQNKELMIEICVTNEVSAAKRDKIIDLGIATIEINLNEFDLFKNKDLIISQVVDHQENRKWVYNSKIYKFEKYVLSKINLREWITRGGYPVKQVSCRNENYFCKLINRYKADLYKHCQRCEYYFGHNSFGVFCLYGIDIDEFVRDANVKSILSNENL